MDFISLNLSVIDMITYIEQLYYHDQVPKISYLDIHYKNTVFNMKSVTPGNLGEIEYSIAEAGMTSLIIYDFFKPIKIKKNW